MRITPREIARLGLPPPRVLAAPANTLIVADTVGFHARGVSARPTVRVEIWGYARRNPFLPWTGLDPNGLPIVRDNAARIFWSSADARERLGLGRAVWRDVGPRLPDAPFVIGA